MPIIRRFKVDTELKNSEKIIAQNHSLRESFEGEDMFDKKEKEGVRFPIWKRFWNFFKIKS